MGIESTRIGGVVNQAEQLFFSKRGMVRRIHFFITTKCANNCNTCAVTKQTYDEMTPDEIEQTFMSMLPFAEGATVVFEGGNALSVPHLYSSIAAVKKMGYYPAIVLEAHRINQNIVDMLALAGIRYMNVSMDPTHRNISNKQKTEEIIRLLLYAKHRKRIFPVVNSMFTKETDIEKVYFPFAKWIIENGIGFNPIPASPKVPRGHFSNINRNSGLLPSKDQIQAVAKKMIQLKKRTGLIATSFAYLNVLLNQIDPDNNKYWECAKRLPTVHDKPNEEGLGMLTVLPNGQVAICQENQDDFNPNAEPVIIRNLHPWQLNTDYLNSRLAERISDCPGCDYGCAVSVQLVYGREAISEIISGLRIAATSLLGI